MRRGCTAPQRCETTSTATGPQTRAQPQGFTAAERAGQARARARACAFFSSRREALSSFLAVFLAVFSAPTPGLVGLCFLRLSLHPSNYYAVPGSQECPWAAPVAPTSAGSPIKVGMHTLPLPAPRALADRASKIPSTRLPDPIAALVV